MGPIEVIKQYRQQGYKDDQIVQAFQQQGMDSQQIYDAFAKVDQQQPVAAPQPQNTEAVIESVIEEKWKEFQTRLKDVLNEQKKLNDRISKVEAGQTAVKENYDRLHEGILGKLSEYDGNIKDVGSSVKAMDQVFKKILPTLTESIHKLSRMSGPSTAATAAAPKPKIDKSILDMMKH